LPYLCTFREIKIFHLAHEEGAIRLNNRGKKNYVLDLRTGHAQEHNGIYL
jgi:hypothetical protein